MIKSLLTTIFYLTCLWILPISAAADTSPWVTTPQSAVRLVSGGYDADNRLMAGVEFTLQPGWKIYWKDPGDSGFAVHIAPSPETAQILWPLPKRTNDTFDGIVSETYTYSNHVIFPVIFTGLDASRDQPITVTLDYGICNQICIPETAILQLMVPAGSHDVPLLTSLTIAIAATPQPQGSHGITLEHVRILNATAKQPMLEVTARRTTGFTEPDLFMDGKAGLGIHKPAYILSDHNQRVTFLAPLILAFKDALHAPSLSLTIIDGEHAIEQTIDPGTIEYREAQASTLPPAPSASLPLMFLLAFLGGLILNLMPCVLPVLSLKILSVLGLHQKSRIQISSGFIFTAVGIIFSFLVLAVIIMLLKAVGMQVGWGFHFQQPYFIVFLILILTLFTASMWDLVDIHLPDRFSILARTARHPYLNHFMTGCFATLLATPCTAPFLGTASGFALSQSWDVILEMFAVMGIGMALPYLLLAVFPGMVRLLPKPGAWMVRFRQLMGIFLAATVLWLLWVISFEWGIISALILLLICIVLCLVLRLSHYQKRAMLALIVLAFTVPPLFITAPANVVTHDVWLPFDEASIPGYVAQGNVVFVDVTAAWCLTCKANKLTVLNRDETQALLRDRHVIAMQADWTNKNPAIQQYLMRYQRAGIPFNIVYGPSAPQGIVLPELLTQNAVRQAIEKSR